MTLQNQNQTNFSQEKDLKIEDFPIHTMEKDLQEANNAVKNINPIQETTPEPAIPKIETINRMQDSSPFLQKVASPEKETIHFSQPPFGHPAQPRPNQITPIKEPVSLNPLLQQGPVRSGKFLNILLAVSLLLAILGGLYYAWYTGSFSSFSPNFSFTNILSKLGIKNSLENIPVVPAPPEPPKYSSDKPNYLNINTENANKLKVEESIKKYADEISALGITAPIEFIVVDPQNNPISFTDFTKMAEFKLSDSITAQLENNFSLFIYNNNFSKLGLIIPAKNAVKLKESLLTAEKSLPEALSPLFLSQKITFDNKPFTESTYNKSTIRYKNLTPELSVDYSIENNKLIIGTSKMTMRAILDYQDKK